MMELKPTEQFVKIQNLCFPDPEICNVSELFYHESSEELSLDGWYNLVYLNKWKAYTEGTGLVLRLKRTQDLLNHFCAVRVYCDRRVIDELSLDERNPAESNDQQISLRLPYRGAKGSVLYVSLVKRNVIKTGQEKSPDCDESKQYHHSCNTEQIDQAIRKYGVWGCFCLTVPKQHVRPVRIGIDICTFRREAYVARNLKLLSRKLLYNQQEEAGKHLKVFVIDNGQTLQKDAKVQCVVQNSDSLIQIFPNKNAGGAGGFTRGMIEVLKDKERSDKPCTHVLLMDDDAVIDPESVVRTYGLLGCLREKWKDLSIGGAMLWEDQPAYLYCQGERFWKNGKVLYTKLNHDLRSYRNAADPFLSEPGRETELYSGWWFCCYSLNTVRFDNLPLPLFLHHDDIEYCLRNRRKGMAFLNGVGAWHRSVGDVFSGANVYYDVRNALLDFAIHGTNPAVVRFRSGLLVSKAMLGAAFKLNYENAYLAYQGFLDFMKGPAYLKQRDPEALHQEVRKRALSLKTLEEALGELSEKEQRTVREEIASLRALQKQGPAAWESRAEKLQLRHVLTLNGQLLPPNRQISVYTSADAAWPWRTFRREKVLFYELGTGKAAVGPRSQAKLFQVLKKIIGVWTAIICDYPAIMRNWKAEYRPLTNLDFWEYYLGF